MLSFDYRWAVCFSVCHPTPTHLRRLQLIWEQNIPARNQMTQNTCFETEPQWDVVQEGPNATAYFTPQFLVRPRKEVWTFWCPASGFCGAVTWLLSPPVILDCWGEKVEMGCWTFFADVPYLLLHWHCSEHIAQVPGMVVCVRWGGPTCTWHLEGQSKSICCWFSVAQSCPTLCEPTAWSTPGFPVLHCFPEFARKQCPLSWWRHPTISSSLTPFSSCFQFFPAAGSFSMSRLFTSDGQKIEASASVLPMNIQGWFTLELISLQSRGLSRIFSSTTVQKHQFFGAQLFFYGPTLTSIHEYWKNHSFDYTDFCQ